ncbi:phosphotransferase enzyme family [Cladorrhinum sp. PSN259]|nr:phosphotransferase enzyme family [Cladorrhinum sp. PSN259]
MLESKPYNILFKDTSYGNLIPTPHDMHSSGETIKDTPSRSLVRIWKNFIVKFGPDVRPIEGENILYVQKHAGVPVPKVYAIYQQRREQHRYPITYIVMEYIEGDSLLSLWPGLDDIEKTRIATQLRSHFDQLRQLQHPGYFGNINGGPPLDDMFDAPQSRQEVTGSFLTEDELIDCFVRIYLAECGERVTNKAEYLRRVLPSILRGSGAPVFTHAEFQRKNIMVRLDGSVVLVDWEFGGWYPSYWEYSMAFWGLGHWSDDWHKYLSIALKEYPNQAAWFRMLMIEMWC